MNKGQPKDCNDASTSSASASAKKKEYNRLYYASRIKNRQPKDRNDVSTSSAYASSEKRKERNKRYYASCKENNQVPKVGTSDISQSDPLMERIPLRTLQTNSSQMTQMAKENVSCSLVGKRNGRDEPCYATRKENGKRFSNGIQISRNPTDDSTPSTTLPSIIDGLMPEISRGFYLFNNAFFLLNMPSFTTSVT